MRCYSSGLGIRWVCGFGGSGFKRVYEFMGHETDGSSLLRNRARGAGGGLGNTGP